VATAYTTQIYERASSLYAATIELQEARGAEQAVRLLGLLRKNQKDVVESLTSGNKDFLYEAFNKALFDLKMTNERYLDYAPRAVEVLNDLDLVGRFGNWLHGSQTKGANPTNDATIGEWIENYGKAPTDAVLKTLVEQPKPALAKRSARAAADSFKDLDIPSLVKIYIHDIQSFLSAINVGIDPLNPNNYLYHVHKLREGMTFLGVWVLPLLYGMLGAVIFHMRRLLDPTVPNPPWQRFAYRIVLGGFAGIIFVWFWTPSSLKLSQPAFATLTSFGLAFLVGFSTDVFFQALDRLVDRLSKAAGPSAA